MADIALIWSLGALVMALCEIRWWRYEAGVWEKIAADRLDLLERWSEHSRKQEKDLRAVAIDMLRHAQCGEQEKP